METLVRLGQAYEAAHHAVKPVKGIVALRQILAGSGPI